MSLVKGIHHVRLKNQLSNPPGHGIMVKMY